MAAVNKDRKTKEQVEASYAVYKLMKIPSPLVVAGFIIICPPAGNMVHLGLVYLENEWRCESYMLIASYNRPGMGDVLK